MFKNTEATSSTGKKKFLALALTGAFVLTLGTGAAYAAKTDSSILPKGLSVFAQWGDENGSIAVKEEDGTRSYSTDGGENWTETAPEGLVEAPIEYGELPDPDTLPEGSFSVSVRLDEDGTPSYSTDGGKTWSKEVPEGVTISTDSNGITAQAGTFSGTIGK